MKVAFSSRIFHLFPLYLPQLEKYNVWWRNYIQGLDGDGDEFSNTIGRSFFNCCRCLMLLPPHMIASEKVVSKTPHFLFMANTRGA